MTLTTLDRRTFIKPGTLSDPDIDGEATLTPGSVKDDGQSQAHRETYRFKRLIEAILFAVEEMPPACRQEAFIEIRGRRYGWTDIKAEYHRRADAA